MSDQSTNPRAERSDEGDAIPLEPLPAAPEAPGASSHASSRLKQPEETSDDACPNCRAPMADDALVCMQCGYDMQAGRLLKPETGVDYLEPPPVLPPFVRPGVSPVGIAIAGAVTLLAAAIAAGMNAAPGSPLGASVVFALLVLYKGVLHTGTGVAGLWAAAYFVNHRVNALPAAVARVLLAVAAFLLIWSLRLPFSIAFLESGLRLALGAAAYWLVLFILFRRSRQEISLVALFHLGAALFVELGFQIAVWLQTSVAAKPGV